MSLSFEWDPTKAAQNLREHEVSFEEAVSVFSEERARLTDEPAHSSDVERFILLGLSASLRVWSWPIAIGSTEARSSWMRSRFPT